MDKKKVSTVLQEVALPLELKGENPFKVRTYSHAARAIETLEEDLEVLIQEARLIELNAHPYRLDTDWRLCKYAKQRGARIAINPDAQEETGLKDTFYGV